MPDLAQKVVRIVLQIPGCETRRQLLDLENPWSRTRRKRPLQDGPERGGIAQCSNPQPLVKIALRPEVLRRDEDAPAG